MIIDFAHSPGALSGTPCKKGLEVGNTEPFQLFYAGSGVLPVFPDYGPNPASDPIIDGPEAGGCLGVPEVIPPALGVGVEPGDNLLDAQPAAPAGEFPHPLLKPLDGF